MDDADTICAISTPTGEGGIGIIRISGKNAHPIVREIFKGRNKHRRFVPRKLYLGYIINLRDDKELDEVFVVFMRAPYTYTCEDISEIYSHGGYGAQKAVLSLILDHGARLAEPGEFTKRAFLNGRIDLVQAESVLDIIRSETDEELDCAVKYLRGAISQQMGQFRKTLQDALVAVEATIDFPEEDIDIKVSDSLGPLRKAAADITALSDSYYQGKGIKQGFDVLIAGRTNVGKSSLLNTLLTKEKAIVTPLPGTTRDLIEDTMYLNGVKINLIDTAGIRKPDNIIEEEGIRRVKEKISEADLVVWLLDGSQPYSTEDEEVFRTLGQRRRLVAVNKTDLPQSLNRNALVSRNIQWIEISAVTGAGIDALKEKTYLNLTDGFKRNNVPLITNVRHRNLLQNVKNNIERAVLLMEKEEPFELVAFELREGLDHLGGITGETCTEDILEKIFHQFCIGK